jgi:hypothetical protein
MRKISALTHTVTIFHGGSDFDEIDPSYFGKGEPGGIRPLGKGLYGGLAVHPDEHASAIETARHFAKKYGNKNKGKTIHAFQVELPAEIKNLASFDGNLGQPVGTKTRMGSSNNKDILGRGDWEAEALGNGDKEISINTPSMLNKLRRVGKWSADTPTEKIITDLNSTKVNEEMKKIPALLEKYMLRENAHSFLDELKATTDANRDDPEWEDTRRLKDGSASIDAIRLGTTNSIYIGNLVAHKPLGGLKALNRIRELADKHGTTVRAVAMAYKSKEDSPENQNIITDTPKLKKLYTHFGASEEPKSLGDGMRYDPKEKFDHYVEWTPSRTRKKVNEDADSFMQELNDTTDEHPLNHKLRVMPDYSASIEASKYSDDAVYIDGLRAIKPGGGLNAMRHIKKLADRHEVVLKAKAFAFMKKPSSNNPSIMTDTDRLVKLYKHFGGSEDPLPDGPRRYGVNMTYTSPNYTPPAPEEPQPKDGVIRLRGLRRQH